jgi:hypothetical protein
MYRFRTNRIILTNMVTSIIPSDNGILSKLPSEECPLKLAMTKKKKPPVREHRMNSKSEDTADMRKQKVAQ